MATILIIDDEEIIRVLLRSALEAAGYEVTEAANGRQGLELYRYRPTDLVITDIGARQTFQKPFSIPHLLGAVRYELEH
jgi:CheY-like chemotaxis protein